MTLSARKIRQKNNSSARPSANEQQRRTNSVNMSNSRLQPPTQFTSSTYNTTECNVDGTSRSNIQSMPNGSQRVAAPTITSVYCSE